MAVPAPPANLLRGVGGGAGPLRVPGAPPVPSRESLGLPPPTTPEAKSADGPLPAFALDDEPAQSHSAAGQGVPDDMLPTVAMPAIAAPHGAAGTASAPGAARSTLPSVRAVADSLRSIRPAAIVEMSRERLPKVRDWVTASAKNLPARAAELVEIAKQNPRDPRVLITAAVVVIVLGTIVGLAVRGTRPAAPEATTTNAVRTGTNGVRPGVNAVEPVACKPVKTPVRLAGRVNKDVALEVVAPPGGQHVLVGYASDTGAARGVVVASDSSQLTEIFSSTPATEHAKAVVPTMVSGEATLLVSTDKPDDALRGWRILSTEPVSMVGPSGAGLGLVVRPGGNVKPLWPVDGQGAVESLRTLDLGTDGYAVVFRRFGAVWMGMLDAQRAPRGALTRIPGAGAPPGSPVGSPVVGHTGSGTVVAFADRASTAEPWSIRLGAGTGTAPPRSTVAFSVPAGGPGQDAIAPSVAGLGDGRVLLVWTEGSQDHVVRAQVLGPELSPSGAAFAVSRPGTNAGQGAVAIRDGRGMVAYLERGGATDGYEMWGVLIECR